MDSASLPFVAESSDADKVAVHIAPDVVVEVDVDMMPSPTSVVLVVAIT